MKNQLIILALASACATTEDEVDTSTELEGNGCTRGQMFVMGTPRNFGVSPGGPLQMACVNGNWQVEELFAGTGNVFAAGGFKFHDTGNWANGTNWGDSRPFDGKAEAFGDGNDLVIDEPGRYRIRFNDRTLEYEITRLPSSCASPAMYVRGTFNGWGTQEMFCVGDDLWAAIPMLRGNNDELKLDTGDWSKNWGDDNGDRIGDRNGANIRITHPGRYLFTFEESTGRYDYRLVSPHCTLPTMYMRGSFNNWGAIAMECENGHYALTLDAGSGTHFKFDAFGDWSLNFGDNNNDFWGERDGANIWLTGRHHVHFYNDGRYAYDRHD